MLVYLPPFRLASSLLLVLLTAVFLACGGIGDKPVAVSTVKLNEELVFNHSTWVVLEAKELGQVLKATDSRGPDKKTDGRFIRVRFKVSNTEKEAESLGNDPVLVSDRGEKFDSLGDQKLYLPRDARTVGETDSDPLPAATTREFYALYDVPAGAKALRLNHRRFQQEGFVELGL
jgi:hypothetical protein